jgi:hypothetical protein
MPNDIQAAVSGVVVKNGTVVVGVGGIPSTSGIITYNTYVNNTPTITTIQAKYDNRFDDPRYYYGSTSGI